MPRTPGNCARLAAVLLCLANAPAAQSVKADPAACPAMTTARFVASWNSEVSRISAGTWTLPAIGAATAYEQALDGPSIMIRIRSTARGCLDVVEIWTRHDASVGLAALVAWHKLPVALGASRAETKRIVEELNVAHKSFPIEGHVEAGGVSYRFKETNFENTLRAVIL